MPKASATPDRVERRADGGRLAAPPPKPVHLRACGLNGPCVPECPAYRPTAPRVDRNG